MSPWLPRLLALSVVLAAGVGASAWGAEGGLAFGPGEQSTYKVSYLGLSAGTAQITVGLESRQWGRAALPIVTLAHTDTLLTFFPIQDRFISYWDTTLNCTLGNDLFADENHKRRRQQMKLDQEHKTATVLQQKEGEAPKTEKRDIPTGSLDVTAVTFALRNQPLAVGRTFTLPVFTGNKTFDLKAHVEAQQTLDTPLGRKDVYRLRIQTDFSGKLQSKRDMVAYFTRDPAHLPVRIEAEFLLGTLVAELTEYKEGRVLAATPTPAPAPSGLARSAP